MNVTVSHSRPEIKVEDSTPASLANDLPPLACETCGDAGVVFAFRSGYSGNEICPDCRGRTGHHG